MVRFVFCLALPEVIHLPRGLEAVTRNWRNHDSTELSAPQSPGEESDGAHCSTKRWEHFPIYFFYGAFFFSSIPLNNSRSPSPSIFSGFQSVFHSAVLVNFLKKNRNFQGCHSQQAAARKSRADAEVRWSAHGSR